MVTTKSVLAKVGGTVVFVDKMKSKDASFKWPSSARKSEPTPVITRLTRCHCFVWNLLLLTAAISACRYMKPLITLARFGWTDRARVCKKDSTVELAEEIASVQQNSTFSVIGSYAHTKADCGFDDDQ
jgi:hypothetical protein